MGNESSKATLRSMAELKREQRRLQRNGAAASATNVPEIQRQSHLRTAQEKKLISLLNEERPRYISPDANNQPSSCCSASLVDPKTNRLRPFPSTEVPGGGNDSTPSRSMMQWNDAWVALMVRCGALAPFHDGVDEDPISVGSFVGTMMDALDNQQQQQKQQKAEPVKRDLLAPPPPRTSPSSSSSDDADGVAKEDSWVVVETTESAAQQQRPLVPKSAPWPLEECCCCLQYFPGLNYCAVCSHGGVCTRCLLHIIKPPIFDASHTPTVNRAQQRQQSLVAELRRLITAYEKERSPPPEMINLDDVARSVSGAFEKMSDAVGASISNFLQSSSSSAADKYAKKRSPPLSAAPAAAAAETKTTVSSCPAAEEPEYLMAKSILELASRVETLGLFACAPRRGETHNNNNNNDDDDDEDDAVTSTRNSSFGSQGDAAHILNSHGAGLHEWVVPDSFSYDDCSSTSGTARALLDRVSSVVMRNIRVADRGSCPLCSSQHTAWLFAGRRPRMLILKDLAALHGCDSRVISAFASGGIVEKRQQQQQQQHASRNSPQKAVSSPTKGDGVWIAPSEREEQEYELCVALSLSAVADAQLDAFRAGGGDDAAAVVTEDAVSEFLDKSVQWAAPCPVCHHVCWKEFRCRVCGVMRRKQEEQRGA